MDTDEFFKDISENITFIPLYIQQIFNAINKDIDKLKLILNSAKNNINKFITLYNSSLIPLNEYFLMPGILGGLTTFSGFALDFGYLIDVSLG